IVEIDVDIAGVAQARGDEDIGGLPDQRLVDVAAVMVPAVPPHRRSEREAFRLLRPGGRGGEPQRRRRAKREPQEHGSTTSASVPRRTSASAKSVAPLVARAKDVVTLVISTPLSRKHLSDTPYRTNSSFCGIETSSSCADA